VEEIELDDKIYKILDPDGLIYRSYKNDSGDLIWLIVQYHLNDRYGAHDPLICHVSQGWKPVYVDDRGIKVVSPPGLSHALNHFIVEKAGQQKLVFFWFFDCNGEETPSRSKMMFNNLKSRLLRRNAISGFVEVSTIASQSHDTEARQVAYDFILNLETYIRSTIRDNTAIFCTAQFAGIQIRLTPEGFCSHPRFEEKKTMSASSLRRSEQFEYPSR